MKSFDIYTKSGCPHCVRAKNLLDTKGYTYKEYVVGSGVLKEDIQSRIDSLGLPVQVRTVPQIFLIKDGLESYIGGADDLTAKINSL